MYLALAATLACYQDLSPLDLAARHQAAIEQLQCITFRYALDRAPRTRVYPIKGQLWRSGDLLRIYEDMAYGEENDRVFRNGEVWSWALVKGSGDRPSRETMGISARDPSRPSSMAHPDWHLLERFYDDDLLTSMKAMLGPRTRNEKVRQVTHRGRRCHVVEFDLNSVKYSYNHWQVFFDETANYRIARVIHHRTTKAIDQPMDLSVLEWAEPKPGVYFPIKVQMTSTFNGTPYELTFNVSDLQVLDALDASIFEPRLRPGIEVFDRIRGQSYRHGDAKVTPMPTGALRPMPVTIEVDFPLRRPESSPWWAWLAGGLTLLVGIAVVWRWRRTTA